MVFPVVMYGCDSWSIKKAEHRRADAFELWCWRRLLRVPWTARRSNQSILKSVLNIHWKDWCWSRNSNTLATWCEELTPWERPWCWERLKMGGEGGDRGWDGWMASPTPGVCSNSCPSSRWCQPFLLPPSILASNSFSSDSVLLIRSPKYWTFSLSISPSNEYSGHISIRIGPFGLPAI